MKEKQVDEKKIQEKTVDEKGLTKREKRVPAIPEEKLQAIIELAGDQTIWAKTVEGGFKLVKQDKFLKSFTGRIISTDPYLMRFDSGVPTKIAYEADDQKIPPGFERRCDVKLQVDDQIIGLSLPFSSLKFHLAPYITFLKNKGLRPEQVATRVFSKQASNIKGTWPICCFDFVDEENSPKPTSKNIPAEWE